MSTPNGAKVRKLQRAVTASALILALTVIAVYAYRSTQAWERDVDRSMQSVQRTR